MEIRIYKDYEELSGQVADEVVALIKNKPDAVICFASGDTPRLCCQLLVRKLQGHGIDHTQMFFIGLDEWVGIPPTNAGSCHYFFKTLVFDPLALRADQTHLFDALAEDLHKQCEQMDKVIAAKGGIDLMIVGIGMNGHIGFNEPGISFEKYAHVAELDETTKTVGQKYFAKKEELTKGITLGLKHLSESKKVILIANGTKKATIVKKALEGDVDNSVPASIMKHHENGIAALDAGAASQLTR